MIVPSDSTFWYCDFFIEKLATEKEKTYHKTLPQGGWTHENLGLKKETFYKMEQAKDADNNWILPECPPNIMFITSISIRFRIIIIWMNV